MLHTSLDGEDYPVTQILDMLGVELPEILRTMGRINEE
jgi:hypothetical protein